MREFRIPKQPISATKSVRFPVEMIDEVEEAIRGQDCTFSAFVVSAVRWALDRAYSEDPRMDTVYTATGTVTIPDGYTYDGTLTVTASLTVTADPENVVVGILEVAGLELPYGAQESDVQLPAQVTVKIKNGHTERADVRWTLDGERSSPGVHTFTGTVSMPPLQYYNGEMNADIKTTVTVVESGATPKIKAVVDYVPLALASIGYMRAETLVLEAARQRLPADVLLRCEDDSYIEVVVRPDDLEFTKLPYAPTPGENQTVSFTGNAALPAGYAYAGGTSPVRCHLEVKALDTAALDSALAAAKTQLDTLTDSEDAALADSEKIFVAANGVTADSVTKGVKFIERSQTATLKDAYDAAQSKQNSGSFTSQTECDQTAQELQEASDAFAAIVPNVGTLYTNAMILEAVKNGNVINPQYSSEFAYSAEMQPLRNGYTYWLYRSSWTVPDSGVMVSIDWSVSGDGAQYLAFAPEGGRDHKNNMHSYGVTVTRQPDEPTEVRFIATVKDFYGNVIGTLGENGEYTATLGAPHHCSDTGKVQHSKHIVRYTVQFRDKIVCCVESPKLLVIRSIDYVATVLRGAGRQVTQVLHLDNTPVGICFFLCLHGKHALEGDLLRFIQHGQPGC